VFEKVKEDNCKFYCYRGELIKNIDICGISVKYIELEKEKMDWGGKFYVPLQYIQYNDDNSVLIQSFPEFMNFIFDFIKKFHDDLFSKNAFDYLYNYLSKKLEKSFNIVPNTDWYESISIGYGINAKGALNISKKQDSTVKFDEKTEYEVIDTYTGVDKNTRGIYYGTLIDGKIVSVAGWNNYHNYIDYPDSINVVEIGSGTHEDYRNKGYAVSNVVAMAEWILDKGLYAVYNTSNWNTASQKTAKSAGFSEVRKWKMFVFKQEEMNDK